VCRFRQIGGLLDVARRMTGKPLAIGTVPHRAVYLAIAGNVVAWLLYGAAFELFVRGVTGEALGSFANYVTAWAWPYIFGYLAFFSPGGLGVREGALTLALGVLGLANTQTALVIAVTSRLWLTVTELLPGLTFLALGWGGPGNQSTNGQVILSGNYGNLTFSNFTKDLTNATIGISGVFTPGSAVGHTITGSTFVYNGTSPQTLNAGFATYNNLTLNNPAGVTGFAAGPIFVIEVVSHFVRIISLSVRLFANLLAGHLLILFMGGGLVVILGIAALGPLTLIVAIVFFIFEVILIAGLQAFIFSTLTAIYLGEATEGH